MKKLKIVKVGDDLRVHFDGEDISKDVVEVRISTAGYVEIEKAIPIAATTETIRIDSKDNDLLVLSEKEDLNLISADYRS